MQAVIFKMDGVIFDSEAKGIECWKEVARRYGIQNIENTCYRCLGVNEKAVVQIFKATYGDTFDFEFYSEKEREIFLSRYAGAKLPQKQGIKELLQWLKDNGIKTAVASSTNRETVKQELACQTNGWKCSVACRCLSRCPRTSGNVSLRGAGCARLRAGRPCSVRENAPTVCTSSCAAL